ncbi:UNVERIFIED_ORG: hypothetical protein M2438_002493 [Methylobacterium sp. SuP10 SLI 274]|uniref:hypothetical protein n=1 Tax=Methylorubrum extorquens TaxID=408 RepID=UPI0020A1E43D|nr:hypothetical protein [Methylorubrum extorquens]MDF9863717.1 hypothetical protein [Methylorubrum pseudosasae]MDH6637318.1 hypothetical protein [Methylobacterium sp. SuP10 SLI 274]MDH6666497.1 hypothetical protein [Methylorubrum zatmanii]MCP1558409.1 hypothetical protein [Methylorubrum extorquens]MDF9792027.1 hypothetical protein [Methylorubrum extorquens]
MTDSIQRANTHRLYREDPTFRKPWEAVRAAFVARWQTTSPAESETRETIYRYLSLMSKLDAFVAEVIRDGEIDQAKLDNLLKLRNAGDSNHLD